MRARAVVLYGVLALACCAGPAPAADSWPVAGGNPSRSGYDAADGGEAPWSLAWTRDAGVRNSPIITGGGGPSVQRVAYAAEPDADPNTPSDPRVHLQVLESGARVGDETGIPIDNPTATSVDDFGSGSGSVAFADTSTGDRLGQLIVVHNDDAAGLANVSLQRIDLTTGTAGSDTAVGGSVGCDVESSPVLTPPNAAGGRVLFFTMACPSATMLVRVPLEGDAVTPDMTFGQQTSRTVSGGNARASVSLSVLNDPAEGSPSFYVAVPRTGGIDFFDADDFLNTATAEITAALPGASEIPQTVGTPAAVNGLVAGAEGSGSVAAPALYVAADAAGSTRVHKLVQDQNSKASVAVVASRDVPNSGAPAPALAVAEAMGPAGVLPDGRLVVSSASNLTVLRTSDLEIVKQLAPAPGRSPGQGFAQTVPSVAGKYVYIAEDGAADQAPDHHVLRIDDLVSAGFTEAPSNAATNGFSWGQPAIARGYAVFGGAGGAAVHRNADVSPPSVELLSPGPESEVAGAVELAARAADARGVVSVEFRLSSGQAVRSLGRDDTPEGSVFSGAGGARFALGFQTGSVPNGDYFLEAVATDTSGRTAATARRRVRIANRGGDGKLPPGACVTVRRGGSAADVLLGTAFGDRLIGGAGNDRLTGGAGHDCLDGEAGDDRMDGGAGDDRLSGGAGKDTGAGGSGEDRLSGGSGNDGLRGDNDDDTLQGNAGRDSLRGGRGDDRLTGGDGNDTLRGDAGNDRLVGGRGNDVISAGSGTNSVDAGAGNDRITTTNSRRDAVSCGSGRDTVTADRRDRVSGNCERVTRRR